MIQYDFVFVVLVYRNTQDLIDFFKSMSIPQTKVIVVNSFFDNESEKIFQEITQENGGDFISVPNKGYGAGNNQGCEYAIKNYDFKYLIISNADVKVCKMELNHLEQYKNSIIAPKIVTLSRKNQNPFMIRNHPVMDKIKNWAYLKKYRKIVFLLSIWSRIEREFYLKLSYPLFHNNIVYAAHGAFIIIPYDIVKKLHPIYNERMFLFAEEEHLAQLARKNKINIIYQPNVLICHKEDGSTSLLGDNFMYVRDSYLEYYKKWYQNI